MSVVIVGASLAGLRTAETLRARGYGEPIMLVGAEDELPYDRPPLSKEYLAQDKPAATPLLRERDAYDDLDVELRLGVRAVALDPQRHQVTLADGDEIAYTTLVIATGANARRLPLAEGSEGFRTLRTVADAALLRADLDRRPRVVVLGGGFIGAEVAAAARQRDLDVDLVELLPAPMSAALGPRVGELLGRLHQDHGVTLRCGVSAVRTNDGGRVEMLELSDGTKLEADLVVMGLGVVPATAWLAGSGLDIGDGVRCDAGLRAVGGTNIYAAGDVARWTHPLFDESLRVEHWTNANEHAEVVSSSILGEDKTPTGVPYVWSDQYDKKIQIVGRPGAGDDITVVEDPAEGRHLAVYERGGRLVGMLTVDSPRTMLRGRKAIAARKSAAELLAGL